MINLPMSSLLTSLTLARGKTAQSLEVLHTPQTSRSFTQIPGISSLCMLWRQRQREALVNWPVRGKSTTISPLTGLISYTRSPSHGRLKTSPQLTQNLIHYALSCFISQRPGRLLNVSSYNMQDDTLWGSALCQGTQKSHLFQRLKQRPLMRYIF